MSEVCALVVVIYVSGGEGRWNLAAGEIQRGPLAHQVDGGAVYTSARSVEHDIEARAFSASPSLLARLGDGIALAPGLFACAMPQDLAHYRFEGAGAAVFLVNQCRAVDSGVLQLTSPAIWPELSPLWVEAIEHRLRGGPEEIIKNGVPLLRMAATASREIPHHDH